MRSRAPRRWLVPALVVALLIFATHPGLGQQPITYVYDALGRLRAVVDPASNDAAIYSYDPVGNLLSIARQSAAVVSIIEFTPSSGPVGTTVTIYGTGFSATATEDTVSFNGTAAAVVSATATQIVATVPAGATTGPIAVTSPAGSATSVMPFTVSPSGAPTITAFAPGIGTPGTAITITGTNFEPTMSGNRVAYNLDVARAAVSSAIASSIVTTVPANVGSGHIAVATPGGAAVSSGDFFIPPSPYAATDVDFTGRMTIAGSSLTATVSTANHIGLVVFDGVAGQRVSFGVTTTVTSNYVSVNNPDGSVLMSPTLVTSGAGLGSSLAPLPRTGTYTILVDPWSSYTGNMTLTLSEDLTSSIVIDGAAVTLSARVGQNARVTFSGTAGQRVSLAVTAVTITQSGVSILKPDGTTLVGPTTIFSSGGVIDSAPLPVTGTYTILVDPQYGYTGNMTLTLSAEVAADIVVGGPPVSLSISRVGQNARLPFSGTSGQRLSLGMSGVTISGTNVSIYNPDGTTFKPPTLVNTFGAVFDLTALPTTGIYTIFVDPWSFNTGNMTLTLSEDLTSSIVIDGAAVPLSIARVGQNARVTFSGTEAQRVSLAMTAVTITQSGVSILKPDGTTLVGPTTIWSGSGGVIDSAPLPVTGTYTILVDPQYGYTGNMTLTLSAEVAGSIALDGPSVAVSIPRVGQRARVTFNGTGGQRVGLGMSGVTISGSNVSIYNPDGTTLVSPTFVGTTGGEFDAALPSTGTYAILVDPSSFYTGNMTLTLSQDLTGSMTIGGAAVTASITRIGQNARLTFAGTSGQQVTVRVTSNTMSCVTVRLLNPSGATLTSSTSCLTNFNLATQTLSTDGTYTVEIDPSGTNIGSITVSVTSP